ncbi:uncharacterized protein LOC105422947 [Pogonomyrmex barbatus]|uniref:Uncharacterized protein LOC105422947 n=1 Tax=Pogonomyrmex barbatus TaxID=144034 RepID=A0A6I9VSR0_9HYME|nr:uncharacterized protein LOC105422947 [Pogonomyrmex barbatus]
MENCIVNGNINNDLLSQSYSQSIERITGTKDDIFDFQIPKELLEVRKKTWSNLFNKYSKEIADDIELNVDTLEPQEEEEEKQGTGEEKEISEEEYSCGRRIHRTPMRIPATLVQYWINTGNPPYKMLLNESKVSESGSSLSEKETTLLASLVPNATNMRNVTDEQKHRNDSSCSSVDTAAYIRSNTYITKKADTMAIIEGAKCIQSKSLKKTISVIKDADVTSNNKIKHIGTARIDRKIQNNDNNVNASILNIELHSPMECMTEIYDQADTSALMSADTVLFDMRSQNLSHEETNKIDELNVNQRSLNIHTIDNIASTFQEFDKASKRLIGNNKNNDDANQDQRLEKNTLHKKQMKYQSNITRKIIAKDTSLAAFRCKKLYTGRDSPVDLILTEIHDTNRLSRAKQSLHPALDSDSMINKETFVLHKNKDKLSNRNNIGSKNVKRKREKERASIFNKISTDKHTNNGKIQDFNIDNSYKSLSDSQHDSHHRQYDISFQNDSNIFVQNVKCKPNFTSINLQPVVLLERIKPFYKEYEFKSDENIHITDKTSIYDDKRLNKCRKLYYKFENLKLETIDDESTTLICQRNVAELRHVSSCLSDCSFDLKLNVEDDSVLNARKKDGKISKISLKDSEMSQNRKSCIEEFPRTQLLNKHINSTIESQILNKNKIIEQNVLLNKSKTYSPLYGRNNTDNVKLREIKIMLERLPLLVKQCANSEAKIQDLNKNDIIWQKEISNKTYSNSYVTNKKDNVKLREIRIVLERLPANVYLKEDSNVTNINIFHNKKKISQNINLSTNCKRELRIKKFSKIDATCEIGTPVRTTDHEVDNYSSKMNTKSKENNVKICSTLDTILNRNESFDKVESDFAFRHKTFQHKDNGKISQDDHSKCRILTFTSSDEDDFVESLHPKKRLKVKSTNDKMLETNIAGKSYSLYNQTNSVTSNKNKHRCSENLNRVIHSSEKTVRKNIGLINEEKKHGEIFEIKSFDSMQPTTASIQMCKNERFIFSSANGNSISDNSSECRRKTSFFDHDTSNNGTIRCSNRMIKKNGKEQIKDKIHVTFFQTKTFYTNSSDSEESNSYTSSSCKMLKNFTTSNKLQYRNCANSKEILDNSIVKKYSKGYLGSLNSSLEKYDRMHNERLNSKSIEKKVKVNKRIANNKESDNDINLKIDNTRKDTSSSFLTNDVQDASVQEKIFLNTNLERTNFDRISKNTEISHELKNLGAIQQDDVTSTVKLLMFQTKSYYDSSDSSEIL